MPWPGADRFSPGLGLAALSFVISIGQGATDSAVVVTVPLHQPDTRASSPPCAAISADGRFVAFISNARLVSTDTNDRADVYVLDRESGGISLETAGVTPVSDSTPVISATGRFLVFEAIHDGDSARTQVLMIRDRESGVVRTLQRGAAQPDGSSRSPSISADGRYVAFASGATNLVDGADANGMSEDVYIADAASMTFRRICPGPSGTQSASGSSFAPSISQDGRFVAFSSTAPVDRLATASKTRGIDTYRYDTQTGVTTRVSVSDEGGAPDGSSYSPSISGNGRYVAFVSDASNLVRRDRNKVADVFVRDMTAGLTELVSRTPSGAAGNGPSAHPALSGDGSIVVFQSDASDLTCGRCAEAERDINLVADIFRHDRRTGVTEMISRGRTPWMEPSLGPATDGTGTVIAFASRHPLDQADDRHDYDLFVWMRR